MSKGSEQDGDGISAEERRRRAEEKRNKREESLGHASIRGIVTAINRVADQLKTNEDAQDTSDGKRSFREKVTIILLLATFSAAGYGDWIFYQTMVYANRAWL